ncbi:MAG: bifunctional adenosylcobinamide kinase/adenosylcobinamide-phosphate guanylyltransferase [Dehalococcoidia bacterium]
MNKHLVLILGGVRSGKSSYAQKLASEFGDRILFLATAEAGDEEMKSRIARHKSSRPESWHTIEEPLDISSALLSETGNTDVVIVDCITVWLSNLLMRDEKLSEQEMTDAVDGLIYSYAQGEATYIIVSGEVGMGIVPEHPLGRVFRDYLGLANQRLAGKADRVVLMVAGIPVDVKK